MPPLIELLFNSTEAALTFMSPLLFVKFANLQD